MSRILIFEKSVFFKDALLRTLKSRFPDIITRSVADHEDCLAELKDFNPDILILGFNVYRGPELALLDQICEKFPGITTILFTDYDIDEYRKYAILRGVNNIVAKDSWTSSEVMELINSILRTRKGNMDFAGA